MPLGFAKTALLGAAGAGGGFEHWFGLFASNTTYEISGTGNGLALDSSDNIGLVFQGTGSPDGSLASGSYPFNAVMEKNGNLTWSKALGPTGGATIVPTYPVSCGFKNTTNGKFYVQAGLPAGGQFGSNSPNYTTNQPTLVVDVNDATGALYSDLCVYEDLNSAQNLQTVACTETHTQSGTPYIYSGFKVNNPTGNTYCPVGITLQEINSGGGFVSTPLKVSYYVGTGTNIGVNIYMSNNQAVDFGLDGSGNARFATVGYAYYSDDGTARFIPYLLMFDDGGGNFNQASPYLAGQAKSGYNYGVYVDGSHNAYCLQGYNDPTTVVTPAVVHKYNSSAVSQTVKAYRADGTGFSYFTHGTEDSSGNLYFAGAFNMNHDSVDNVSRAALVKFNSSLVPQWYRAIDVEPANASSSRYSSTGGLEINSDGNIAWSFQTGSSPYGVGGVAVLPTDGSGTGTYSIDGHTLDYIDISSKITDVSSNFSFSNLTNRFTTYSHTLGSVNTLTPGQNGGANVPGSITTVEV